MTLSFETFCARSLSLANLDGALSDRWCAVAALLSCIPVIFLPSPPNPAHAPVDDKPDKGEEAEGAGDEAKETPSHVMPMLWMTVWIYGMNEVIRLIGAEGLNRRGPVGSCRLFLGPGFRLAAR